MSGQIQNKKFMLAGRQKYRYNDSYYDNDNDNKLLQDPISRRMMIIIKMMMSTIDNYNCCTPPISVQPVMVAHSTNTIEGSI
jgi:hypothetical protein